MMGLITKAFAVLVLLVLPVSAIGTASAAPTIALPNVAAPSPLIRAESDPGSFVLHKHLRHRNYRDLNGAGRDYHLRHYRPRHYKHRHYRPRIVIPHFQGYRGWRYKRPGYRRHHNGWWYPRAAFGPRVIIRKKRHHRAVRGLPRQHFIWCDRRYRSYRAWDDTFQPYRGPRRHCNSPYDGR